jgi:predicted alpha/beta-hydrolase family hydrolase
MLTELTFTATPEKGEVSALLLRPADARALLVLGHGASTNMRHTTLQTIAERLFDAGIATFRYQFPYMERGGGGRDSQATSLATVRAAVAAGHGAASDLPLLVGGHSFGGRMASLAAAEAPLEHVRGLVFFAFPLHLEGRTGTERAEPLQRVTVPMLFLSGTRDKLADLEQLRPVVEGLGERAALHLLDTADHGFHILKRTRQSTEDVFVEMARVVREWTDDGRIRGRGGEV